MNLEFIKPQNLGSLLMKSSQSNFNLRSPGSYLVRSYLITTVMVETTKKIRFRNIMKKSQSLVFLGIIPKINWLSQILLLRFSGLGITENLDV